MEQTSRTRTGNYSEIKRRMTAERSLQHMDQIAEQFLALTNEAALYVRRAKIVSASTEAKCIFGSACVGQNLRSVIGSEASGSQAASYISEVSIGGARYAIRVAPMGEGQIVFITPTSTRKPVLNDAFLGAARSTLMSINLACSIGRSRAEQLGDDDLLKCFISATRSYYVFSHMFGNISTLHSLAYGSCPFQPVALDISGLCANIADETRELFGEIDFSLNLPEHIEISADRELLQQAVTNVISNCIEHASGLTRISISLLDRNDSVILSIADDGCGMPQAAMNALFRDVERSPELINLSHGAGLGLELVRAVAEKHNGSLHIESRENVGTTIRLSLSKGIPVSRVMRCEPEAYKLGPAALYTAFANCLPEDFFAGKYMD